MTSSLRYEDGRLLLLDQTALPSRVAYITCTRPEEVEDAICGLKVRGAPLLGIAAAFAMVLATRLHRPEHGDRVAYYRAWHERLLRTRPTAVNLAWALGRMAETFTRFQADAPEALLARLEREAEAIRAEDAETNRKIGQLGAGLFSCSDLQLMTVCNAGALATGGYGTALGVIRALHDAGQLGRVWACETRPVLQGARLTVWELMAEAVPVTLITDNAAAWVMKTQSVDAVVTGADRIALNGDAANKIGSYALAILAAYHGIPFYVAASASTADDRAESGAALPVEERGAEEVRRVGEVLITLPDASVYNPAFDVVPGRLITGIITEAGVKDANAWKLWRETRR